MQLHLCLFACFGGMGGRVCRCLAAVLSGISQPSGLPRSDCHASVCSVGHGCSAGDPGPHSLSQQKNRRWLRVVGSRLCPSALAWRPCLTQRRSWKQVKHSHQTHVTGAPHEPLKMEALRDGTWGDSSSVQRPIFVINLRKNAPRGSLPATKGHLWKGIGDVF